MSTPKTAPYKLAQREAQAPRGQYLVIAGQPLPDSPYALRVRRVGDVETGHRKVVKVADE